MRTRRRAFCESVRSCPLAVSRGIRPFGGSTTSDVWRKVRTPRSARNAGTAFAQLLHLRVIAALPLCELFVGELGAGTEFLGAL